MDVTKMGLRRLKFRYGESNGKDRDAEQELQRRGFNWRELREVIHEHDQLKWRKEARKASKIRGARKAKKRILRRSKWRRRCRKRRRQATMARVAGLETSTAIVAGPTVPSAPAGS